MPALISLNPMLTTNAAGLFNTNSAGFTQGDALDDPAVKFALAGGYLVSTAATPIWGGVPIQEFSAVGQVGQGGLSTNTQPGTNTLGSSVDFATTSDDPTGVVVYNQAYGGITTPQSTAPLFSPGMSVNFYRFGSGARIPMVLATASVGIDGDIITTPIYYNYSTNQLTITQPGSQTAFPGKVIAVSTTGNKTVSYDSGTNNANWVYNQYIAIVLI
jgi:hypothetical protein